MDWHGHVDLQLMALVDPHWKITKVLFSSTIGLLCFVYCFFLTLLMFVTFSWDYIRDGSNLVKNMDRLEAFYKGLTTWAHWVEANVDPSKTKLFFQGISPTHYQ